MIKGGAGATYTINGGDGSDQIRGGNLADTSWAATATTKSKAGKAPTR